MNEAASSPALDAAIEACADCARLYSSAADLVEDEAWRLFMQRMALRRETLLHRLRFAADEPADQVEQKETEDFVTIRGRLSEVALSLKGLFGDQITAALDSLEPAETRLVDSLGAIEGASADPGELREMLEAVTEERDALRNLLAGLGEPTIDEDAAERRLE